MNHRDMGEVLLMSRNDAALARAVGVSHTTIQRWRKQPDSIPLGKARLLSKIQGGTLGHITKEHIYT